MADAREFSLDIRWRYHVAILEVSEIKLHGRLQTPFQRQFVDPHGGLAAVAETSVHPGKTVIWSVYVGAIVGRQLTSFDGRIFP